MIEMNYDEAKNNLKLPKNIRQVGKPNDKIKIYVEDYVITYINQIARESSDKQRLAVLLGRLGKNDESSIAFIDGAVEAKEVVVQEDQVVFTSEIWTQIYDEIGQYFHNTEIVGWFLTRPGKSLGINEKITKIHVDNFPGVDKALFIIDPFDHDEAFYIYNQGDLVRQEGYYIYYERNEDMQNYMIDHGSGESTDATLGNAFLKKREEILERKQDQKDKERERGLKSIFLKAAEKKPESEAEEEKDQETDKPQSLRGDMLSGLKRASSLVVTFAVLFALIFAFNQVNQKQQSQKVSSSAGDASNGTVPVDVVEGRVKTEDEKKSESANAAGYSESQNAETKNVADAGSGQTIVEGEDNSVADGSSTDGNVVANNDVQSPDSANTADTAASDDNNTSGEDVPAANVIRQYEVKLGDTLAGISQKFYSSYKYIEEIQEMNQIEDPNMIFPGMTLNLP